MTELVVPLPYAGPYTATRSGKVLAADGREVGVASYRLIGDQPLMMAAAHLFAASPALALATVRLSLASADLLAAQLPGEHDAAEAEVRRCQALAWEAIASLRNPTIAPDRGLNAPIAALLERLPAGAP